MVPQEYASAENKIVIFQNMPPYLRTKITTSQKVKKKKNHLLSRFPGSVQVRPRGMKLCLIYLMIPEGQLKEQELHPQIPKDLFKLREDGENEEKAGMPQTRGAAHGHEDSGQERG